jgi:AraC-like DNA-binding protein
MHATSRRTVLPTQELAPYVRNYLVGGFSSLENHLPAIPYSQLVIYINGRSRLQSEGGTSSAVPTAFIAGPSLSHRLFLAKPDSQFIAASFRSSGLQSCLGIPAHVCREQLVPLENFVLRWEIEKLADQLARTGDALGRVQLLEDFLIHKLRNIRSKILTLPMFSVDQLLSPAEGLAKTFAVSTRQFERRFLVTYGMTLREYRRLARFSLALMQIMAVPRHPGAFTRIAQDASYVDQSHLIRDFRQFIGDTPLSFAKAFEQPQSKYSIWRFTPQELKMHHANT